MGGKVVPVEEVAVGSVPYNNIMPQLTSVFSRRRNPTPLSQNLGSALSVNGAAYDYYDNDDRSVFAMAKPTRRPRTTTTTTTTTTPFVPCTLTLYSKTYRRGESETLTSSLADLADFNDKAVSALVEGTCCWQVFAGTEL